MLNRIKNFLRRYKEALFLNKNIPLIYGKQHLKSFSKDEIVITCLFQNGEKFIPSFIEHHLQKGFKHFVFIDNSSTDNSIAMLKKYPNTIIYTSELPYKNYKWIFKQFLTKKVGAHQWSLYLDIDELWDYPNSDTVSLNQFTNYLNQNNYTAVMAQMLDMFPENKLHEVKESGSLLVDYPMYSIDNIAKTTYTSKVNKVNNVGICHHRGGIHNTVFDIDDIYLTKIPMIKWSKLIDPHLTSHTSSNVNIADVSTVLYHFKFTKDFYLKIEKVINDGSYWNNSATYKKYKDYIEKEKGLNLNIESAKVLKNVNQLVEEEFLLTSAKYHKFAENLEK